MNNKQVAAELVKLAVSILDGAAIEHPRIKPQHNPPKEQRAKDLARINKALKQHKLQAEPSSTQTQSGSSLVTHLSESRSARTSQRS